MNEFKNKEKSGQNQWPQSKTILEYTFKAYYHKDDASVTKNGIFKEKHNYLEASVYLNAKQRRGINQMYVKNRC